MSRRGTPDFSSLWKRWKRATSASRGPRPLSVSASSPRPARSRRSMIPRSETIVSSCTFSGSPAGSMGPSWRTLSSPKGAPPAAGRRRYAAAPPRPPRCAPCFRSRRQGRRCTAPRPGRLAGLEHLGQDAQALVRHLDHGHVGVLTVAVPAATGASPRVRALNTVVLPLGASPRFRTASAHRLDHQGRTGGGWSAMGRPLQAADGSELTQGSPWRAGWPGAPPAPPALPERRARRLPLRGRSARPCGPARPPGPSPPVRKRGRPRPPRTRPGGRADRSAPAPGGGPRRGSGSRDRPPGGTPALPVHRGPPRWKSSLVAVCAPPEQKARPRRR